MAAAAAIRGRRSASPGFYKLEDTNGDDVMDTIERIQRYTSTGMGDHGPHAIRRAPDGSITFLIGNNTYVGAPPVNDDVVDKAASPNWNNLKERQFLPAVQRSALRQQHADRRARDGVAAAAGQQVRAASSAACAIRTTSPTTSPARRSRSTATWNGTSTRRGTARVRTIHMIPGGDGGYRNGTGKFQDEYFDVLPALRHLRRGSPVGVEIYQSYAYPSSFFDNLFEADWSRGRLLYTALTPSGATYRAARISPSSSTASRCRSPISRSVRTATSTSRRAVRAGQGGLYKVSWTGAKPAQPDMTGILAVVRQPQPLSSWGWAAIERLKASMGASFGAELEKLARTATAASGDRARAMLELQRHGPAPSPELLRALVKDRDANVRAAAVYVAGVQTSDGAKAVAAAALKDAIPLVQRRAAEALVRQGLTPGRPSFAPVADIYALLQGSGSLRPLLRAARARAHAAQRVDAARHERDERRRADRRAARARPTRRRRSPTPSCCRSSRRSSR